MKDGGSFEVFIEIPKGIYRRLHLGYLDEHGKREMIDLGPIRKEIPVNKGAMPVAYGFIIGTLQKDEAALNPHEIPDEVDACVYSTRKFKIGERVHAKPIAMLVRQDGDHKLICIDSTMKSKVKRWEDIPEKERKLWLDYFGYKSKVISIENAYAANAYIQENLTSHARHRIH